MSVIGVVMISSPGSGSMAAIAQWTAAEPEEQAMTYFAPSSSEKRCSRVAHAIPLVQVRVPLSITLTSSATSSAPSDRPDASWSDGNAILGSSSVAGCITVILLCDGHLRGHRFGAEADQLCHQHQ